VELSLRLCASTGWFWFMRGYHREGSELLTEALALSGGSDESRSKALMRVGAILGELSEDESAVAALEDCIALRRRSGDRVGLGAALGNLCTILSREASSLERAREVLEESVEIARELDDEIGVASGICNLGVIEQQLGRPERARPLFEESAEIAGRLGHKFGRAVSICNLGTALLDLGAFDEAEEQLLDGIKLSAELGHDRTTIGTVEAFAVIPAYRGDFREAARLLGAAGAARASRGMPLTGAFDQGRTAETEARVREGLDPTAYANAVAEGGAADLDTVVAGILNASVTAS
jgi:tetratricopeptide (TPR) repeat protein